MYTTVEEQNHQCNAQQGITKSRAYEDSVNITLKQLELNWKVLSEMNTKNGQSRSIQKSQIKVKFKPSILHRDSQAN